MIPSARSKNQSPRSGRMQISGMLMAIGVHRSHIYRPGSKACNGGFWSRNINHIAVLDSARVAFRKRILQVHPDKPGGSHIAAADLNRQWRYIKRKFKFHGYELI